jgi:hypothetical protein
MTEQDRAAAALLATHDRAGAALLASDEATQVVRAGVKFRNRCLAVALAAGLGIVTGFGVSSTLAQSTAHNQTLRILQNHTSAIATEEAVLSQVKVIDAEILALTSPSAQKKNAVATQAIIHQVIVCGDVHVDQDVARFEGKTPPATPAGCPADGDEP